MFQFSPRSQRPSWRKGGQLATSILWSDAVSCQDKWLKCPNPLKAHITKSNSHYNKHHLDDGPSAELCLKLSQPTVWQLCALINATCYYKICCNHPASNSAFYWTSVPCSELVQFTDQSPLRKNKLNKYWARRCKALANRVVVQG